MSKEEYTKRFEGRARAYAMHRPTYPREIIRILRAEVGYDPHWVVADIGSGTGALSDLFLEAGSTVYCVEPNRDMRVTAEKRLHAYTPRFISVAGTAESTGLTAGSVDLVGVGQALHWFAPAETKREFGRILRSKGFIAVVYNHRREDDDVGRAYAGLIRKFAKNQADVPDIDDAYMSEFLGNNRFKKFILPNSQTFRIEGLLGRLASASYMPKQGSEEWVNVRKEASAIIKDHGHGGEVALLYETIMYLGELS